MAKPLNEALAVDPVGIAGAAARAWLDGLLAGGPDNDADFDAARRLRRALAELAV